MPSNRYSTSKSILGDAFPKSGEGIYSNFISVWLKRYNQQKKYYEWMRFNESADNFEVFYWIEQYTKNYSETNKKETNKQDKNTTKIEAEEKDQITKKIRKLLPKSRLNE